MFLINHVTDLLLRRKISLSDHDTTTTGAQNLVAKPEIGLMLSGHSKQFVVAAEADVFSVPAAGMLREFPHTTTPYVTSLSIQLYFVERSILSHYTRSEYLWREAY
jgi:hypothetical protein